MAGRHRPTSTDPHAAAQSKIDPTTLAARHAVAFPQAPPRAHHQGTPPRRRPWRWIVLGIAAVAIVTTGAIVAATRSDSSGHARSNAASCTSAVTLHVIAAPSIAPAITTIATRWQAGRPAVDGRCVQVSVTAQDSRKAEQSLVAKLNGAIWIPDSTVWSSRLTTDAVTLARSHLTVGRSIASSPLVIAAPPTRVAAVLAAAKGGWVGTLTGATPAGVPEPTATTEGALTLLSLQGQLGTSPQASATLAGLLLQLSQRVVPNSAAGFAASESFPTTAPAFVASEQEVIEANAGRATPVTTAVYPSGTSPVLDFPFVTITPSAVSVYAHALQLFDRELGTPAAARIISAIHLRNAAAAPLPTASDAAGVGNRAVQLTAQPTPASVTAVLRRWVAVGSPRQILAVIDVSGSMDDDAGAGQSKILVASAAATTALSLMPDTWSVGLWTFSVKPAPGSDWTQLVPLGLMQANRSALLSATHSMPDLTGGDTGLYNTTLAAFQSVTAHYDPRRVNSVLLLTDGANTDLHGVTLPELVVQLRKQFNPQRPVRIYTIALGKDADAGALQQISAATGGHTYAVRKAEDINAVFAQIALQAS